MVILDQYIIILALIYEILKQSDRTGCADTKITQILTVLTYLFRITDSLLNDTGFTN